MMTMTFIQPLNPEPLPTELPDIFKGDLSDRVCDFCSKREVVWCYVAHEFISLEVEISYDPLWLTCRDCYHLIEAGRMAEVTAKIQGRGCVIHGTNPDPEHCAVVDGRVAALHAEFCRQRVGPGWPLPTFQTPPP